MSGTDKKIRKAVLAAMLSLGLGAAAPALAGTPTTTDEARSFAALQRMAAIEVMHLVDAQAKGYVTRDEFLKFQERFFSRMDQDGNGKVDVQEWTGKRDDTLTRAR